MKTITKKHLPKAFFFFFLLWTYMIQATPSNDLCGNAIGLGVGCNGLCFQPFGTEGTTVDATDDGPTTCDASDNNGVWYWFSAPISGPAAVDIWVNSFNGSHKVALFQGGCGGPELWCGNAYGGEEFTGLFPGFSYYILVYSDPGSEGYFHICVQQAFPNPANDICGGATSLTVNSNGSCPMAGLSGTTEGATSDGISSCTGNPPSDVWYWFSAPATSFPVNLRITSTSDNHGASIYQAGCGGSEIWCGYTPVDQVINDAGIYYVMVESTGICSQGTFDICVQSVQALPVELTSFRAEKNGSAAFLSWETASETNNSGFAIERKNPANQNWDEIAFVEGMGTSQLPQSYSFTDKSPQVGVNYYRLRQMDFDGQAQYSSVVSVDVFFGDKQVGHAYPNPMSSHENTFKLPISISHYTEWQMELVALDGRTVQKEIGELEPGEHTLSFTALNTPPGLYFLKIKILGKEHVQRLFIH